jgi:hypothetical protein
LRGVTPVELLAAVAVVEPLPVPLVGFKVTHDTPELAVQAQLPALAVTVMFTALPAEGKGIVVGSTVNVHGLTPFCVTETVWPPTVIVAVRLLVDELLAAVTDTVMVPVPEPGDTVNHD